MSWIIRGIPPLILLFFSFFALPQIGLSIKAFQAAAVGLILYTTFYYAEAIRSGLASIQSGQYLAARSLGFTSFHTLRRIIIPQAFISILPPYISFTMDTIKGTSLASAISVAELMGNARRIIASTYLPVEILIIVAIIYGLVNQLLVVAHNQFERRFDWR